MAPFAGMTYAEARGQIMSGDLLAFSHKKLESFYDLKVRIVRLVTMSKYSHVATAFVEFGRVWILEAVTGGPRIAPLSNVLPCDWIPLNAPWRPATEQYAMSKIGKEGEVYSEREAIKGYFLDVEPGKDSKWMCAEWVWELARRDNIYLGEKLTPSDIVEAAQRLGAPIYYLEAP